MIALPLRPRPMIRLRTAALRATLRDYGPMIPLRVDIDNAFMQPWMNGYFPSSHATCYRYMVIAAAQR